MNLKIIKTIKADKVRVLQNDFFNVVLESSILVLWTSGVPQDYVT